MPEASLYIGLDAGATKTALAAQAGQNEAPISLVGAGANLKREGLENAAQTLCRLVMEAARQKPESTVQAVCAGVAGAGRAADRDALAARMRQGLSGLGAPRIHIVHDAEIALEAAFEGESGIILIVGTGSVVLARTPEGTMERAGGWGYLLGDEGSGYVLGIHGLRAVTAAFDGGPATRLQDLLAERHGIETADALIQAVYDSDWKVQEMAPLVVQAARDGDGEALRIIAAQTDALARQVEWLARRCPAVEPRIAFLGGLSQNPFYRKALMQALLRHLPGWRFQEPLHPPVIGALRLALQLV